MAPDRIEAILSKRPFQRFALHVGDGRRLDITHPEISILLPPKGRSLIVVSTDDRIHLLDVFLITGIDMAASDETMQLLSGEGDELE